MLVRFEWDPAKAATNLRKHGVSFEFAMRAFSDPLALVEQDHVEGGEYRSRTLGVIEGVILVVVAHTVKEEGDTEVIRIISARRAEPREKRQYYEQANR